MSAKKKTTRVVLGSPAARRLEPVTIMSVLDSGDHWSQVVLPILSREAGERGWRLMRHWHFSGGRSEGVKIDGVLTDAGPDNDLVRDLLQDGYPVVRLGDSEHLREPGLPAVLYDNTADGKIAADHFSSRGFHHVGFAEGDPWGRCQSVLDAFRKQADELGMACHVLRLKKMSGAPPVDSRAAYQEQFLEWLQSCPKPLGLLTFSDYRAAQFCYWAVDAGMAIPTNVAVLGRGNTASICDCTWPSVSSIERDEEGRVRSACDLLSRLMAGDPAPSEPVMIAPKGIVERESTNVLATSDPDVAAALCYMWDHLDKDLSVDDIAREVGVARRTLERGFRTHLHRGVNAELRRKRLEVFRDLLVSSDLPIAELAPMVGFGTMAHLQRSFRTAYGMSPRQFRAMEKRTAP